MTAGFDRFRLRGIGSFSALVFAAAIAAVALQTIPVAAETSDIATCDRLAALPDDKDKPADVKGGSDIADVAAALRACKAAAAAPNAPRRVRMELGRA